ncbi:MULTISPECIES: hypothetical protein [Pseudomonas]|jgi:hypothetical protein|nr:MULTISPECIES: hypothetical protein [Pseudomonas]
MNRICTRVVVVALAAALLALVWWGWQRGGLALMQLGMSIC